MLRFESGDEFASGATKYSFEPPADPKLGVQVEVDGIQTLAVVDTAAPYLICSLWLASQLDFSRMDRIRSQHIDTRFGRLRGSLYRLSIKLLASEGSGIEIQATAVVPDADEQNWRDAPTFLGFQGCLERLRFAVDPFEEKFYFGL